MPLIDPRKKYTKLITTGCSFSTGFAEGPESSWGHILSKKLDCEHVFIGGEGSSNDSITGRIISYCELNKISSDCCVGVQWSNFERRCFWRKDRDAYFSFGGGALRRTGGDYYLSFIKEHFEFFNQIWFEQKENIFKTVKNMVLVKNYLENKGIDYVMFEGIGSVMDGEIIDPGEMRDYSLGSYFYIEDLFKDPQLFTDLGDMEKCMKKNKLYDLTKNGGHPNKEFVEWWCEELIKYFERNFSTN